VDPAVERTRQEQVTFLHPFSIGDAVERQAPGTYTVETIEEPIDGLSFIAYRRVATTIVLPSRHFGLSSKQAVTIDPRDLEAARERDAEMARQAMPGRH
jgi:hypothetical protein